MRLVMMTSQSFLEQLVVSVEYFIAGMLFTGGWPHLATRRRA
jgi:hypothetical protein